MITCSGARIFEMVRVAPVADRGVPPARDPRGHAEEKRVGTLGPADGAVKGAIFGYNAARFYRLDLRAELPLMRDDGIPG